MHQRKTRKRPRIAPGMQILLPSPLERIKPGNDFFKYVNGRWIDSVHVPPYISSYGISEEVEQSIEENVEDIIRECIESSKTKAEGNNYIESIEISIGRVARSALNTADQEKSVLSLQNMLKRLDCMRDTNDIAITMGEMARYKIKGLLWPYGQYENKRNTKYTYRLGVGAVGLPDLSYYTRTAPGKSRTLFQYASMLQEIGKKLHIDDLSDIVGLESILASAIQKSFGEDEVMKKGSELQKDFPDIPFQDFFEALGLENWKTEVFFIDSIKWIQTIQKMMRHLSLQLWKLLFASQMILHFLAYLPPPFDDIHFRFYRRRLRGQTEKIPQKKLTVQVIEDYMTPFISRLYVEKKVNSELKTKAQHFTNEIIESAEERVSEIEWLQAATREKAKEKVKKMKVSVAYPDHFSTLRVPRLGTENLLENILLLGEWQTEYEIERLGEKRDEQQDWDEPVFDVNAYYYSQANEFVLPTGSLYWPFFSPKSQLGWNHGSVGCIIGHEITHAFDKEGKDYDPDGYAKKWWTSSDNRAYNKKVKSLIELFNNQKVFGHPISGSLTLSENIADLGGMAIALHALRKLIKKMNLNEEEQKEAYRQFFISYAVSWRVKEKPAKVLQSLFLDHHSPAPLRVNLIVAQFQEWYDAFDIESNNLLYIPPENRIRIF